MADEEPILESVISDSEKKLDRFFRAAIKNRASDLHLKVGQPPKLRMYGGLKDTTGEVMTEERIEELVFEILTNVQKKLFLSQGTLDFAYELEKKDRFRINIFRQRGAISMAARRVESRVPQFEELHLPKTLEKIADRGQGLVLVVGPTGSGKTTTIASMIDFINQNRNCHIVTVEDPIEYVFQDKKAIVSQREVGIDVKDFDEALTYLMRQDPDVVFVGEMRESKTVTAGMRAAETGHLVFGTMHSANASQAVGRLLELFPQNERDMIRQNLSLTLKAIVSQLLLPSIKEKIDRVPVIEIMLANPQVRKMIAESRESDLPTVIRACQNEGMIDITENLCKLIKEGFIDPRDAFKYAPNPEELKMALKGIKTTASGIL
ncbi:MAG: PilT/PilU family type 4a pilus ATPase [Sedimentisphaerales bacterium]|nr:PilT/PilU family type 4a pilus ATPase [Sedimentisphaerales bacterium]